MRFPRRSFSRGVKASDPPVFSAQPTGQALYQENGVLSIPGAAAAPVTAYQWQILAADGTTWTDVANSNSATLTINNATNRAGTYRVKAINGTASAVSTSVQVVSVYLGIQNDASAQNGSAVGTTKVDNTHYTHNAAGGTRYFSAFYKSFVDDSNFTPAGASTARAVANWTSSNQAAVPLNSVSASGQLTTGTKTGSSTLVASIGNLSSTLSCVIS